MLGDSGREHLPAPWWGPSCRGETRSGSVRSRSALLGIAIGLLLVVVLAGAAAPALAAKAISPEACKAAWTAYRKDRSTHARRLETYWNEIAKLQRARADKVKRGATLVANDFVQNFPPDYTGRAKPGCRDPEAKPPQPSKPGDELPVLADFLSAAEKEYAFVPHHVSDMDYMRQYASESLALGLTAEQVVGVYSLETGGLGPYFRQSGIFVTDQQCRPQAPKGRAASTALGYAQLLAANSAAMTHLHGDDFAAELERRALGADERLAGHLRDKAGVVRRMVRDIGSYIRRISGRNGWKEYVSFGKTRRGHAVHALNLDVHIGPMIQTRKLKRIVEVAADKGYRNLPSADLELLNLVGYGRGLQMLEPVAADVPSSNFFSRLGYERNPVVAGRTARGVRERLASIIAKKMSFCGSVRFLTAFEEAAAGRTAEIGLAPLPAAATGGTGAAGTAHSRGN
ncbi:MAG: hypothetical protein GC150_12740 [Rhizobiales bacterium]|nr:hypothetical protein [Hyphomicrobiales bacterium]